MRFIAVLAVACKGTVTDPEGSFPRACDESTLDGDCILFSGLGWVESDVVDTCEGIVGLVCPPARALGACTVDAGADFEAVTTFYTGFWRIEEAIAACQDKGGAWVGA